MKFQLIKRTESEKGPVPRALSLYESGEYRATIYQLDGEVCYPVLVKAVGPDLDVAPEFQMMSISKGSIQFPPSISIDRLPALIRRIETLEAAVTEMRSIIKRLEDGD